MSAEQEEPKIVVDEDWKSRVRAEREAARAGAKPATASEEEPEPTAGGRLPPASFELLLSTLAAQALTAMGKLPDPTQGHAVVRPDLAQHYIDMLGMLEQKTQGNLTKDEAEILDGLLHHLRMSFVTTRKEPEPKAD